MYVQQSSIPHDCTSEAGDLQLTVPENVGDRSSVVVAIRNAGTAVAWLSTAEEVAASEEEGADPLMQSALSVDGNETGSFGPYRADSLPVLHGELGSNCVVTLLVEGR